MIKRILILFTLIYVSQVVFAQKRFQVTIKLDTGIDQHKVICQYDNGKNTINLADTFKNQRELLLKGEYFSTYATFNIYYNDYSATFFIGEKPALLNLYCKPNANQLLLHHQLLNAQDVFDTTTNNTYRELLHFNKNETLAFQHFLQKYSKELNSNDSLHKILLQTIRSNDRHTMLFLKEHSNDYFSFWYFENQILSPIHDRNPDTAYLKELLAYLKSTFPKKYTQSIEGKELIKAYENAIHPVKIKEIAPLFNITTIDGKKIHLNNLKGKLVLIDFWATWCAPCMNEVPYIKEIRQKYPSDKLVIIGISQDHDLTKLKQVVNKKNMNWLQFFDKDRTINKLYGVEAYPTLILLDKSGKIIYKSDYIKDDMKELTNVLSEM